MFRVLAFNLEGERQPFFSLCKKATETHARKKSQTDSTQPNTFRAHQIEHAAFTLHTHIQRFAIQRALLIVRKQLLRARKLEILFFRIYGK